MTGKDKSTNRFSSYYEPKVHLKWIIYIAYETVLFWLIGLVFLGLILFASKNIRLLGNEATGKSRRFPGVNPNSHSISSRVKLRYSDNKFGVFFVKQCNDVFQSFSSHLPATFYVECRNFVQDILFILLWCNLFLFSLILRNLCVDLYSLPL